MILSSRVEEAAAAGDYPLALRLINQIMDMSGELVLDPRRHVYYPASRRAVQLLRNLPPAGVRIYEQLVNAEAAARFATAKKNADLGELRELFRRYPIAADWPDIGRELVARYLEDGTFADAVAVLREMESAGVPATIESRAQSIVALTMSGATSEALALMSGLANETAGATPAQAETIKRVSEWYQKRMKNSGERGITPLLQADLPWRAPLNGVEGAQTLSNDVTANAIGYHRALPLITAVTEGDTLVLRARGVLWAIDALTMTRRWQVVEPRFQETITQYNDWAFGGGATDDESSDPNLPPEARTLLHNALQHAVSTGAGFVYTIEPRSPTDAELTPQTNFPPAEPPHPNVLVARDALNGQPEWRVGADPADPLYGGSFQDVPQLVDDRLLVMVRTPGAKQELTLVALNPRDGKLLARATVVGPPFYLPATGGRAMLVVDESTIYIATGNGAVAALDRATLAWKWAATYSTANARMNRWFPWGGNQEEEPRREYSIDRPIVAADVLVVAAVDSAEILAFDRFDGRLRWRIDRREALALLGAVSEGVLIAGSTITCISPADGTTVAWRSVPLELTGRIAIDASSIFVPTRGGVLALDARNGRVIAAQHMDRVAPATDALAANLAIAAGSLMAAGPNEIAKYPDPVAVRTACEQRIAAPGDDPRARLALAWVRSQEHDFAGALELLEHLDATDTAVIAARDALLSTTFVALSRSSAGAEERLTWLRRAASLPLGDESASDLALLVGRTLEDAQRWSEALAHYKNAILHQRGGLLVPVGDGAYRRAAWLDATARIQVCLAKIPTAEADAFFEELAADAEKLNNPSMLERARRIVGTRAPSAEIDRALLMQIAAPELAADYLSASQTGLDDATRARLLLKRWEIHVALGALDAAHADREIWRRDFAAAATQPASDGTDDTDARRVEKLEWTMRKLEQALDVPFDEHFYRVWADNHCELILDAAPPRQTPGSFILTRDLGNRQIVLRGNSGDRRRVTADAVAGVSAPKAEEIDAGQLLVQRNENNAGPSRSCWPSAVFGQRAVLPVFGGIACVGLGPERAGGKRLWESPTGWTDIPLDFFERCAVSAAGVCFSPRGGRLELLDWSDGRPRWVRELGAVSAKRVMAAAHSVIVLTDDRDLLSIDAEYGERVARWASSNGSVLRAMVIDDVLVVRTEEAVSGFDPDTLDRKWSFPIQGTPCEPVIGRPWVLIRPREVEWSVVDVHTGRSVLQPLVHMDDSIMAVGADERLLFVATQTERNSGRTREAHVQAYDLDTAKQMFIVDVDDAAEMNATQLIAHERYIPVLTVSRGETRHGEAAEPHIRIVLIDKRGGTALPAQDIDRDFPSRRGPYCAPLLVASPTRMFVQMAGTTAAYGATK